MVVVIAKHQLQQIAAPFIELIHAAPKKIKLLQLRQRLFSQRRVVRERGFQAFAIIAFFAGHGHRPAPSLTLTQGFALGGGNNPGLQPVGLPNLTQMGQQALENSLKNVGCGVLVQTRAHHHGIHQALVAAHQLRPSGSIAFAAAGQQGGVVNGRGRRHGRSQW
jgi:hypothetical protein